MKPMVCLVIPLGGMPDNTLPGVPPGMWPGGGDISTLPAPGRPGYPSTGPVRPGRPVDPGYGIGDIGVGGGPAVPPGGVAVPPIALPPELWPPAATLPPGEVMPPIAEVPPGVWPPPPPPQGFVLAYLPGYGWKYVKLPPPVVGGPPVAQPKV